MKVGGQFKIKKKKRQKKRIFHKKFKEDMYVIISITAVIFVVSFALGTVSTTEAALNSINSPSGMASLSINEIDSVVNESMEPILVKNRTIWQLRKLRFK